jgi:hypothetical protein
MEKFAFLFRGGLNSDSPEVMQKHMQKWLDWVEKLRKNGTYLAGEPLHPGGKKIEGPTKSITDGPFTEAKDIIGGFFIVNAKDYSDAVEIAKDCPDYTHGGTVEVRQVMKM